MGMHISGGAVVGLVGAVAWSRILVHLVFGVDLNLDSGADVLQILALYAFGTIPGVPAEWMLVSTFVGILFDVMIIILIYLAVNEAIPG